MAAATVADPPVKYGCGLAYLFFLMSVAQAGHTAVALTQVSAGSPQMSHSDGGGGIFGAVSCAPHVGQFDGSERPPGPPDVSDATS